MGGQQVQRVHRGELRRVAAERGGEGAVPVAERGFLLPGQVEERRVALRVVGRHLQRAGAAVGQAADRPGARIRFTCRCEITQSGTSWAR